MSKRRELNKVIFLKHLVWLITNDEEYLGIHAKNTLDYGLISNPELGWMVKTACEYFVQFGGVVTREALVIKLQDMEDRTDFDVEVAIDFYDESFPVESPSFRAFLLDYTNDWLQKESMAQTVADVLLMLEEDRVQDAQEYLMKANSDTAALAVTDIGVATIGDLQIFKDVIEATFAEDLTDKVPTGIGTLDGILRGGAFGQGNLLSSWHHRATANLNGCVTSRARQFFVD